MTAGTGTTAGQRRGHRTVAEAMITAPALCPATSTVGDLRHFFADAHVHAALVVDEHALLAVVDRDDLTPAADTVPAADVGALLGRTVRDTADLAMAERIMRDTGRRRLAVVDADGRCVGLLCLKSSGTGFCTDDDLAARHHDRSSDRESAYQVRSDGGCRPSSTSTMETIFNGDTLSDNAAVPTTAVSAAPRPVHTA